MTTKVQTIVFAIIFLMVVAVGVSVPPLYRNYGMQRMNQLDDRDIETWQYTGDVIIGAESFYLDGNNDVCWLMVHGYGSTPAVFSELADKIHSNFSDIVSAIRLSGHGEVPSKLMGKDANDWYNEALAEYDRLAKNCDTVNLVGSSLGGTIVLRLAEEKDAGRVYLISPFFYIAPKKTFSKEMKLKIFGNILNYEKKKTSGSINDPEGLKLHISYMNLPFEPFTASLKFVDETKERLGEVTEPILMQHSKNDKVSDIKGIIEINDKVQSKQKKSLIYERSNHILLKDYDREEVIDSIIDFENENR